MSNLKTILTVIAVILGALAVIVTIGFIYTALQYLLLFGVLLLAGYIGLKLLGRKQTAHNDALDSPRDFKNIDTTLEEYKRRLK